MGDQPAIPTDLSIARIAAGQHGVISIAQLAAAGIGKRGVARRARRGRLHRVHRGVYAVGHLRLSNEGRWLAAVLACGAGAVLSHRGAGALWGFAPARSGPVDITIPGTNGRSRRLGMTVHRSSSLMPRMITSRKGIPVTTPARTLRDLRRVMRPAELRKAIREAEALGVEIGGAGTDLTRSELEHVFLRLCRRHRLPPPEVNVSVEGFVVDFLWRERRLIVEWTAIATTADAPHSKRIGPGTPG